MPDVRRGEESETEELVYSILDMILVDTDRLKVNAYSTGGVDKEPLQVTVKVEVAPKDRGNMIGKDGLTFKAIQRLLDCLGARLRCKINLTLLQE